MKAITALEEKNRTKKPLAIQAYELLKEKIITLEFPPGVKLEEQNLMARLKLGRTPIREAVRMLISEGLIVSHGSNSTYVKDLTLKSARDLLLMLHSLGDVIFGLADPDGDYDLIIENLEIIYAQMDKAIREGLVPVFAKMNADFHRKFGEIANNVYLDDLLERLYCEEVRLAFVLSLSLGRVNGLGYQSYYENIQQQHRALIEALKDKDFDELKRSYRRHLASGQKRLSAYFARGFEQKRHILISQEGADEWRV